MCCGWVSRGVAIGDGKVYIGQVDGFMVELDQKTGPRLEDRGHELGHGQRHHGPRRFYYDGLIYTGITGGEFGVRGRLTALDAKTGVEKWRFYTIPGPGETGHALGGSGTAPPQHWR